MKNYEKKYKEALERAKKYKLKEDLIITQDIFPELKESEDERIRKEILEFFSQFENGELRGVDISSWIAWLEKQGTPAKLSEEEQNRFAKGVLISYALSFIDYLDAHKYEGKMCVSNGECIDIEIAFHNTMWDRLHRYYCKYIEKQGEQKPVGWSEEDEENYKSLENLLNEASCYSCTNDSKKLLNWLKFRLSQKQWKPSEEEVNKIISIDQQICDEWGISKYTKEHKEVIQEIVKRFIKS